MKMKNRARMEGAVLKYDASSHKMNPLLKEDEH